MRRFQKIRGAMLIYAFIIVSLLIVLLTASMLQLQNSVFLTKKMEAETKAYWVSFAGAEYADAKITQNITWPMQNISYKTTIGAYEITEEVVGNYVRIRGTYKEKNSSSIDSEFYLAFKTDLPSAPPAGEFSIVPTPLIKDLSTPSKNISCYSINAVTVASNPGGGLKIDNKLGQDNEDYVIFKEMVIKYTKITDNVICTDLRGVSPIYVGNRFMLYSMYPEQNVSLWVVDGRAGVNTAIATGYSIVNRSCTANIGALMLKHGGGGHMMVGTCQVDIDKADEVIEDIIENLRGK